MRLRRRREFLTLAASATAGLAGCPGSSSSGDPGIETPNERTTTEPGEDDLPGPPADRPLDAGGRWPQAGFDAGNTACNPDGSGVRDAVAYWRLDAGGTPTMRDGALYNISENDLDQEQLTRRDPGTAAVRTRTTLPVPGVVGPPAIGRYVYVSTFVRPVACRRSRGVVWAGPVVDGAAGPPTVREDRVYVAGRGDRAHGTLPRVAVLTENGDFVWDVTLGEQAIRSPAVAGRTVVVATDSGVVGLENGVEQWRYDVRSQGTPALADGLVFVPGPEQLHVLDADSGMSRWMARPTGESLVVTDDLVVTGGRDRTVARDVELGEFAWEQSGVGRPLAAAGQTLYTALDANLTALDLEDGTRLWNFGATRVPLREQFLSDIESVTPVDGALYVRTTDALHGIGPA